MIFLKYFFKKGIVSGFLLERAVQSDHDRFDLFFIDDWRAGIIEEVLIEPDPQNRNQNSCPEHSQIQRILKQNRRQRGSEKIVKNKSDDIGSQIDMEFFLSGHV